MTGQFYFLRFLKLVAMPKRSARSMYLFVSSLIIGLFSFPFAFAKTVEKRSKKIIHTVIDSAHSISGLTPDLLSVYDSLNLSIDGINRKAFEFAQYGFERLKQQGIFLNDSIISIIDFSLPSTEKRLFVLDLKNYKLLFKTYVAHGRNSGKDIANSFSNKPRSYKSSLGFYRTLQTYFGSNGFSLKLQGLEKGINDNAFRRAIVMHGADYVSPSFAESQGYIGRSQGCPAVMSEEAPEIINTIKDGSCLFIYHPSADYRQHSSLLPRSSKV